MSAFNFSNVQRSILSAAGALVFATMLITAAVGPVAPSALASPVL